MTPRHTDKDRYLDLQELGRFAFQPDGFWQTHYPFEGDKIEVSYAGDQLLEVQRRSW